MKPKNTRLKVCLDTNVIVSAVIFDGNCEKILDLVSLGRIDLVLSPAILNETARVLRDKFERSDEEVRKTVRLLLALSLIVEPKKPVKVLSYDPDNRVLECALEGKVDYLVTGDKKHLLVIGTFKGAKIVTPADFLSEDFRI